jgi:hypothetical protein
VELSHKFVPVFIDTLKDHSTTERFEENFGSYPVLRVHDLQGNDIGGRIDTNPTAGIVGTGELTEQMNRALSVFQGSR